MQINARWFSFLALIFLSISVSAQPAAPAMKQRHTLWKVQGQSNAVYLLGSVHVLKKTDYPWAARIEAAFSNSPIVAIETEIAALEDPAVAMKLLRKSQLPARQSLKTPLSPAVYQQW